MIINITDSKIIIDDLLLRTFTLNEFKSSFGESTRLTKLKNHIYTYDDRGICVYSEDGYKISQISVDILKDVKEFSPKNTFKGDIVINNVKIENLSDVYKISADDIWDDELEGDGIITVLLKGVEIAFEIHPESKKVDSIDFWYK